MIAWVALVGAVLAAGDVEVSHRGVQTSDGVTVGLVRYSLGPPAETQRRVLIVGELGFGRALWEAQARRLAGKGWVVYVALLRGQGGAGLPGYHLADCVIRDLPAIGRAMELDGAAHFSLIAHGFGGTLALAAAGTELLGHVDRVFAISTPVEAQVPSALVEHFLEAGGHFSALGTDPEAVRLFELVFGGGARVDPGALATVRSAGVTDLGRVASSELLGWMRSGDLALGDGTTVRSRLKRYRVPTWLVLPLDDGFASSEMAAPLREVVPAKVTTRALNRAEYIGEDYTHVSLVLGNRAGRDVWAAGLRFLAGSDP